MSHRDVVKPAKMSACTKGSNTTKPPPQKRAVSEVSPNSSVEEIMVINHHLDGLTEDIQKMRGDLKQVLKKEEMKDFIQKTVMEAINDLNRNIEMTISIQVEKMADSLKDRVKGLEDENSALRKEMESLKRSVSEADKRSKVALARANYNEQYSRKNNVKIMDIPESQGEKEVELMESVSSILAKEGVKVDKARVVAIHRIPGKEGKPRPVLVKFVNNTDKASVMTHRKGMKARGHRLVDDVTKMNVELMKRLTANPGIESAWFFNGSVYGKTKQGARHRFDVFDIVSDIISAPKDKGTASVH